MLNKKQFVIMHTADWHLDRGNLDFTLPVIDELIDIAKAHEVDLVVNAGDIAVHRGHIHPDVAFLARKAMTGLAGAAKTGQAVFVSGNHDMAMAAHEHGMGAGILSGTDPWISNDGSILVVESPKTLQFSLGGTDHLSLVCIPTPNVRQAALMAEDQGLDSAADVDGMLARVIGGAIADTGPGPVISVFHGTVRGGRLGNEMVMKAGIDVSVPAAVFGGSLAVLAGHLHHGQTVPGDPPIHYPGAIAPLTWNDKLLQPSVFIHRLVQVGSGGWEVSTEQVLLPVVSQLVDIKADITGGPEGRHPTKELAALVATAGAGTGDRVRITLAGGSESIAAFKPIHGDAVKAMKSLRSLKMVFDRTDSRIVHATIDADWTVADAFKHWAAARGMDKQEIADCNSVVDFIERQVVDKHLDARYECRPLELAATNWCQFETVDLDFTKLGSIASISGHNFAGKSNLARLLLFTRYKRQECGDNLADLVRKGTDRMAAAEKFMHGDDTFMVSRSVTLSPSGKASASMDLAMLNDEGQWELANEGTARETQAKLERMIGPYELFRATTYAGQNDVDGLLDFTPSELKDVLLSVLQRDFAARARMCRAGIADLESEAKVAESRVETHDRLDAKINDLNASVDSAGLIKAGEAVEAIPDPFILAGKLKEAEAAVAIAAGKERELAVLKKTLATFTDFGVRAADDLSRLQGLVDEGLAAATSNQGLHTDKQTAAADGAFSVAFEAMEIQCAENNRSIMQAGEAAFDARAADLAAQQKWESLKDDRQAIDNSLSMAVTDAGLLEDVPCGGDRITDRDGAMQYGGDCQFLINAMKGRDQIPDLTDGANEIRDRLAAAVVAADKAAATAAAAVADQDRVEEVAGATRGVADAIVADARDALAKSKASNAKAHANRGAIAKGEAASESLDLVAGTIAVNNESMAFTNKSIAGLGVVNLAGAEAVATSFAAEFERDARLSAAAHADLAARNKVIDEIRAKVSALAEEVEEVAGAANRVKRINADLSRWRVVSDAMGRDGIPFVMLERYAIPTMEGLVNRYLAATDIRVSVEDARELGSGELRSEVLLRFTDHRGSHPISSASGYQRTAIGMALRNALADLHSRATGSRIWLAVQDEGFGTMDEANLDKAKETIQAIAKERGLFIFISHVPGLEPVTDSSIRVHDNGGVSCISVEGGT